MDKKQIGLILLIVGLAVVLISGLADILGYGEGSFGPKQGVGVIVGLILIILGWLWWKGKGLALPNISESESKSNVEVEEEGSE